MGDGREEKGTDTAPGKLCQRGKFWNKILGEITERERVGVSDKDLLVKQYGTHKLTIIFQEKPKPNQKFGSLTTNKMEKMKNVNDNAIRIGEQGSPEIFLSSKYDTD